MYEGSKFSFQREEEEKRKGVNVVGEKGKEKMEVKTKDCCWGWWLGVVLKFLGQMESGENVRRRLRTGDRKRRRVDDKW